MIAVDAGQSVLPSCWYPCSCMCWCRIQRRTSVQGHPRSSIEINVPCRTEHDLRSGRHQVVSLDKLVTWPPTLRFAVTALDDWPAVERVANDLRGSNASLKDISYLGLLKVLIEADNFLPAFEELSFPGNAELIGCTFGPLAERLYSRLQGGAETLQAALGHWLIGRHAAHIAHAIEQGNITVWVRLLDAEAERLAYQSLLAHSSNSVGVHDLVDS